MAIMMGGRRFLGYDLSAFRRVGQRGPLAGLGALPSASDIEAKIRRVQDNPWTSVSTVTEIRDLLGGALSTTAITEEVARGGSPGTIAQRLLARAAAGGVAGTRSLDDLARGKVKARDTIAVSGVGVLRVANVEYDKDNVVVGVAVDADRNFDVYETASKGVTSNGAIFYESILHLVAPGGAAPSPTARRVDRNTKSLHLSARVAWDGFARSPGATRLFLSPNYVASFGPVRQGTTLRTNQSWSRGFNEGSVEERVFLDAEKAESDAATTAARNGKSALDIRSAAETARAMTIMSGMGARSYAALPQGFQNMITKGAADRAAAALGAGVPPPSPPSVVTPRPPRLVAAGGPPWGTIAAVTGGVLVIGGLIAVFARRRRA